MRIRLLTAIAVLGCSMLAWADDSLPPVPKRTVIVLKETPTITVTEVEATAIVVKTGDNTPMPSTSGKVKAMPRACAEVQEAPLPPVCGKAESLPPACGKEIKDCSTCNQPKWCFHPIRFLFNELFRKPVYAVQKARYDAEGQRLACEACRLKRESERLAFRSSSLEEQAKEIGPHDLHAKLKLLAEEIELTEQANCNAARRTNLDCRQAEHCRQKDRLQEKHDALFPARN